MRLRKRDSVAMRELLRLSEPDKFSYADDIPEYLYETIMTQLPVNQPVIVVTTH